MPASSSLPIPEWWEKPATAAMFHATAERLIAIFELRACRFEPFPFNAQRPRIEPGRIVIPPAETGIADWHGEPGVELPVRYRGLTLGRFLLAPATATTGVGFAPDDRAVAIAIAGRVGQCAAAAMLADGPPTTEAVSGVPATLAPFVVTEPIVDAGVAPRARAHRDDTKHHRRRLSRRGRRN